MLKVTLILPEVEQHLFIGSGGYAPGDVTERSQCATVAWKLDRYLHDRGVNIIPPKSGGDEKSDLFIYFDLDFYSLTFLRKSGHNSRRA